MTPLEILRGAYQLIGSRETWTQRTTARRANGENIAFYAPEAASWCALGAIFRTAGIGAIPRLRDLPAEVKEAVAELTQALPPASQAAIALGHVTMANDHYGYEVIDRAFYETIKRLSEQEEIGAESSGRRSVPAVPALT